MSDLISRKALCEFCLNTKDRTVDANDIMRFPSAEPERKKGEWIKHENPTLGHCMKIIYECSVCHKAVGCEYFVRRSFCPNCGADMRGE